jgi:hypothetical protein
MPPSPALPLWVLSRQRRNAFATYGELIDDSGAVVCLTLELPWRNNAPGVSSIPARPDEPYLCVKRWSPEHKKTLWWVTGVDGRDDIEMHIGCLPCDSRGCILVGSRPGYVEYPDGRANGKGEGVLGSGDAFDRLMNLTADLSHLLLRVVDPISLTVADQ